MLQQPPRLVKVSHIKENNPKTSVSDKTSNIKVVTNYFNQCREVCELYAWHTTPITFCGKNVKNHCKTTHTHLHFWIQVNQSTLKCDLRTLLTLDIWWVKQRIVMIEAHLNTWRQMSAVEWHLMQSMLEALHTNWSKTYMM